MCLLGRLRNVYYILWPNIINVKKKVHLMCRSTLEEVEGDLEGFSLTFTRLQLKDLLNSLCTQGLQGSQGLDLSLYGFWREEVLLTRRLLLNNLYINKEAQGLNRIQIFRGE